MSLNIVAHMPGTSTWTTVTSASARDIDFVLAQLRLHGFHVMMTKAEILGGNGRGALEQCAGARESPGCAARGHGADEDAGIGVMALVACVTWSPRSAPPVARLEGSTAMIATVFPRLRISAVSASTSVLLPAPGGPVMPTVRPSPSG